MTRVLPLQPCLLDDKLYNDSRLEEENARLKLEISTLRRELDRLVQVQNVNVSPPPRICLEKKQRKELSSSSPSTLSKRLPVRLSTDDEGCSNSITTLLVQQHPHDVESSSPPSSPRSGTTTTTTTTTTTNDLEAHHHQSAQGLHHRRVLPPGIPQNSIISERGTPLNVAMQASLSSNNSDDDDDNDDNDNNSNEVGRDVSVSSSSSSSFWDRVQDRAGWLVGLLVLQSMSSFIISRNEDLLSSHLVIVQFLTMLVGAGGNAGNQASVRVIRGLATGTVNDSNVKSFLRDEVQMGIALSGILGLAGCVRASVFAVPVAETLAITTSLCTIVFISIVLGALLPLGMKRLRIDPAHSSTTIQVLMDILGVTITVVVSGIILDSPFHKWLKGEKEWFL